jgi:uncharacterized protein (DUF1330 family)
MAGYIIGEIEVTDPVAYERYRPLAAAAIARHGGKYLVRGGATESLEGEGGVKRIVVLEFPTVEQARRFYDSPDYQDALTIRLASATGRVFIVAGV